MAEYAKTAAGRGIEVIVAAAGGAAHLPGMVAAHTALPVLGVPIKSSILNGVDSLLSIVQMPAGVPVGTLAIGAAGAVNAALLTASILATSIRRSGRGSKPGAKTRRKPCSRIAFFEADSARQRHRRSGKWSTRTHVRHGGAPHGISRAYTLARSGYAHRTSRRCRDQRTVRRFGCCRQVRASGFRSDLRIRKRSGCNRGSRRVQRTS